ncbi:MAG: hypothetical protein J0I06_13100 [Planctomycetes bacterium]|nr:hypothetical protein [Planctomycetota bacterium]
MRFAIAAVLFAAVAAVVAVNEPAPASAQDKKDEKKVQPKFDPPKAVKPDEATLKTIKDKTDELRKAVAALKEKKIPDDVLIEVEIYLKAAENIVRFSEWYTANSGKWALTTLDQGLARAKQAEGGKAVWRDAPGKWVVRAYRSQVDDSIQPYAILLPHDYGQDPKKKWRLDIVLHGRDASLTEAKFIATHQGTAPKGLGYVQLEVYGRGNNAYRWAGETDVMEAMIAGMRPTGGDEVTVDLNRFVLRGFSMGGAGTWHFGLHRPGWFCVIGPGAGFTTTHGYIANLPKELPDYQEKCLRIYDAYLYAENAFNVPVVAYSGEKDAQKKAADNIENALKAFKEPLKFTHLVAPGLEHQMPKEWQEKAEAEYRKYADRGRADPALRVRLVAYTPRYGLCDWVFATALGTTYERAVVDATRKGGTATVTTTNVRRLELYKLRDGAPVTRVVIDGQTIDLNPGAETVRLLKRDKWELTPEDKPDAPAALEKRIALQGPIDDAFMERFVLVGPDRNGWHPIPVKHAAADLAQFAKLWDRYFRGAPLTAGLFDWKERRPRNLVLFGDPQSNSLIAKVLPKLPITWTKDKLVVNGVEYDPKTHVPVLIYPNPLNENRGYVVINSGHTFKEADLKGTNALLYPRLGDWAVIKPTPTDKDPAAYEVVAAGLFDENWQFPKKK